MNELSELVSTGPLLPEWARFGFLNLLSVYIMLKLVRLIRKNFKESGIREALVWLKELGSETLRRVAKSLELPVERPRAALIASAMNAGLMYLFVLLFFAWFGVFLMLSATGDNLVFHKRLIGFAAAGCSLVLARWYLASAERQRIAVAEGWKVLRDRRDA